VAPAGLGTADLLSGVSALRRLPRDFPVRVGAPVERDLRTPDDFPYEVAPRALLLAVAATDELVIGDTRRTGLVFALSSVYAEPQYLEHILRFRDDHEAMGQLDGFAGGLPLAYLAGHLGIDGPRVRLDTACASGSDALAVAHEWIIRDVVDDVVVVAAASMLNPVGTALFHNLRALAAEDDLAASRPFDRRRAGFVMGEGAAAIWLSNRDADDRLGYIAGHGRSMNAEKFTDMPTQLDAMERACRGALGDLPVPTYICTHGTGTPVNDPCETRLYKRLFGRAAYDIPMSSIKSMTGHCLGASSLIEAVVTLAALREQTAPPTMNLEEPDPSCDLDYVPLHSRPIDGNYALSTAFAFGGHNSAILLAREASR
jgi:3-oxoacyl-(acyl-carrier-protein) synthase